MRVVINNYSPVNFLGISRRGVSSGPPLNMDDTGPNNWKGNSQGDAQGGNFGAPNNGNNFAPVFPPNQGSPAGNMPPNNFQGPGPGSNTPQYTASPAPSGSSTPGPGPPSSGFPQPQQNSQGPPFGSPSSNGAGFGRPGSSGPSFPPQFGAGPNNFVGAPPGFMAPSGSFHGQGHPMNNNNAMGPGHHAMMGGPQVDRLDPR